MLVLNFVICLCNFLHILPAKKQCIQFPTPAQQSTPNQHHAHHLQQSIRAGLLSSPASLLVACQYVLPVLKVKEGKWRTRRMSEWLPGLPQGPGVTRS